MNPPKGYRHCVVGEIFPSKEEVLRVDIFCKIVPTWDDYVGEIVDAFDVGHFFFKEKPKNTWSDTPTDIFNKIFPVEDMDFEDCQQYLAAIIERKFTQEEFTKLCKAMAKERIDSIGDN